MLATKSAQDVVDGREGHSDGVFQLRDTLLGRDTDGLRRADPLRRRLFVGWIERTPLVAEAAVGDLRFAQNVRSCGMYSEELQVLTRRRREKRFVRFERRERRRGMKKGGLKMRLES